MGVGVNRTGTVSILAVHASAAVTTISSSSSVLDINLTLFGVATTVVPLLPAAGSAPPAYNVTASLASFSLPPIGLSTGALTDTASSSYPPTETGTAISTIDVLMLDMSPILGLSAETISSTSSVDGRSATGSTAIDNLTLTVLGSTTTFSGSPPPNDLIFDSGGLTVTLNQQIPDTSETAGISTNAIAIDFVHFPANTNVVNGSIDIASSTASIVAIPEPAIWLEMLAGFGAVGLLMWGRTWSKGAA